MRLRDSQRRVSTEAFPFELESSGRPWFVYLFALTDYSAFKVGFSCNPLQRICTFTRRYFERFDLSQSVLFEVGDCEQARVLEAMVKTELAPYRVEAPAWVPREAGGHTEWFSAVYFGDAEARLHSSIAQHESLRALNAFDFVRADLQRVRSNFEPWAVDHAQRAIREWAFAQRGYVIGDRSTVLQDWLDAYRYFGVPLFVDESDALEFVTQSVRARTNRSYS